MKTILKIFVISAMCAFAVSCGKSSDNKTAFPEKQFQLLKTVPSDACVIMSFDRADDGLKMAQDSLSAFRKLDLGKLGKAEAILSYVYTGDMTPLLAVSDEKCSIDSTALAGLEEKAAACGLKACKVMQDGNSVILFSKSEAVFTSVQRHLDNGTSILDADKFQDALALANGNSATVFISNKLANEYIRHDFLRSYFKRRALAEFIPTISEWTVLNGRGHSKSFDVNTLQPEGSSFFMNIFNDVAFGKCTIPSVVPASVDMFLDIAIPSAKKFREAYVSYLDANVKLDFYNGKVADLKNDSSLDPVLWEKTIGVKEIAIVGFNAHKSVVVVRASQKFTDSGVMANPYRDCARVLYGSAFNLLDDSYCATFGHYIVMGSEDAVTEFTSAEEKYDLAKNLSGKCKFRIYSHGSKADFTPSGIKLDIAR